MSTRTPQSATQLPCCAASQPLCSALERPGQRTTTPFGMSGQQQSLATARAADMAHSSLAMCTGATRPSLALPPSFNSAHQPQLHQLLGSQQLTPSTSCAGAANTLTLWVAIMHQISRLQCGRSSAMQKLRSASIVHQHNRTSRSKAALCGLAALQHMRCPQSTQYKSSA
jgi:hypothetical protein